MLTVRNLKILQLPPISFTLEAGQGLAVMGPSGTGKSLLLRAIADLDPAIGEVFLDGRSKTKVSGPQWRRLVRYVAAEPGWWAETVREHFPDPDGIATKLNSLGLSVDILDKPVAILSTGERIRLALLRAMADEPKVLLLDEPTGPLDETSRSKVAALIKAHLADQGTVVLVTHDSEFAQRLGFKVLELGKS